MKTVTLKLPELGLLAITRVALGAGVALLISTKLDDCQGHAAGLALAIVGLLTTIPFAVRRLHETD